VRSRPTFRPALRKPFRRQQLVQRQGSYSSTRNGARLVQPEHRTGAPKDGSSSEPASHGHLTVPKGRPRCGQRRKAIADSPVRRQQLVQRQGDYYGTPGGVARLVQPELGPGTHYRPQTGQTSRTGNPAPTESDARALGPSASGSEAASAGAIHVPPRSFPGRSRRLRAAREGGRADGGTHLEGRPQRSRSETGTGSGSPPTFGRRAKAIGQQPTAPNRRPVGVAHRDLPRHQGPQSGTTAPG